MSQNYGGYGCLTPDSTIMCVFAVLQTIREGEIVGISEGEAQS